MKREEYLKPQQFKSVGIWMLRIKIITFKITIN